MEDNNETYVYNELEVKKTGRTAEKPAGARNIVVFEITPVNEDDGNWKKWVMQAALFTINVKG